MNPGIADANVGSTILGFEVGAPIRTLRPRTPRLEASAAIRSRTPMAGRRGPCRLRPMRRSPDTWATAEFLPGRGRVRWEPECNGVKIGS